MGLKESVAPLFKWWWLIIAATLVATGSSYLAVRQQPLVYQTRTTLMIGRTIDNPNPSNNEFSLSQQLAITYADIAKREPMRERTMAALGVTWLPDYAVRALPNTQLIEIVVTDTSPERAQVVANELANQLILQSPTASRPEEQDRQNFIDEQLNELEVKIPETQDEILAKQEELETLVSAREISEIQNQITALQAKLTTLQANYAALLSNTQRGAINTLTVIDPAALPRTPVGPNNLLSILTASAIGFVLAATAAYLLEYLDDTVKSAEDVTRTSGLATVASIARIKIKNEENKLVSFQHPHDATSEAFRTLRTAIQLANPAHPKHTLLVTSPNPAEGKSVTAANLAIVLAQAGYSVLLMDADLRRPMQHRMFGRPNDVGLVSILAWLQRMNAVEEVGSLLDQVVQSTTISGLSLLTSGPVPANPSELIGSASMKDALTSIAGRFDYTILDSSPCLPVTDAILLSTQVDGVVLVVHAGRTWRNQLKQAVARLQEVNAPLLGVALNRLNPKTVGYNYYAYQATPPKSDPDSRGGSGFSPPGRLDRLFRRRRAQLQVVADKE
jgi:polysaccharide biosynthesis transport protein